MDAVQKIRCFDLGGGGLKTAVVSYDSNHKRMTCSRVYNLGKCPDNAKVKDWVRQKVAEVAKANLNNEIREGYHFGFSLAGLDKLRSKPVKKVDIYKLFDLPKRRTSGIDDGAAHLIASLHKPGIGLPEGRIWNFSIGTGVGFAFTNKKKEVKPANDVTSFFEKNAWEVTEPKTGQPIWEAGSSRFGFDQIVEKRDGKVDSVAFEIFADRWKSFIEQQIIDRSKHDGKSWGAPAALVFTGGHVDHYPGRLVNDLKALGLKIPVFEGPENAGLLGAAWNAVR